MADEPKRTLPAAWKIGILSVLYFAQGLPAGFQANALPLYVKGLGVATEHANLTRVLALPWLLKALWAPLVDRHGSSRFGRRKSWIVPLQLSLAAACATAAFVPISEHLSWLLVCVLAMNFFAATQDIAVDGLAVDLLEPNELGGGNAAQVVGYKVGMLVGGGVLVSLSIYIGWRGLFFSMAALVLVAMTALLLVKEEAHAPTLELGGKRSPPWPELMKRVWGIVRAAGAWKVLLVVSTYKIGEALAESMFGLYLQAERGVPTETVAGWLGTWGMVGSLLGSLLGGFLATRLPIVRAMGYAAALRVLPLLGQWALVAFGWPATAQTVVGLAVFEHLCGGALTTACFAFMMSKVDRRIGATHYTVLATVEVLGKTPAALFSGYLVRFAGYPMVFAVAVALSAAFLLTLLPLREVRAGPDA